MEEPTLAGLVLQVAQGQLDAAALDDYCHEAAVSTGRYCDGFEPVVTIAKSLGRSEEYVLAQLRLAGTQIRKELRPSWEIAGEAPPDTTAASQFDPAICEEFGLAVGEIVKRYTVDSESLATIAGVLRVERRVIKGYLDAAGVRRRLSSAAAKLTDAQQAEAVHRYTVLRESSSVIALDMGVTPRAILERLRNAGVRVRGKGGSEAAGEKARERAAQRGWTIDPQTAAEFGSDVAEMVARHVVANQSVSEIHFAMGISYDRIRQQLDRVGVPRCGRGRHHVRVFDGTGRLRPEVAELVERYRDTDLPAVADRSGYTPAYARALLAAAGVTLSSEDRPETDASSPDPKLLARVTRDVQIVWRYLVEHEPGIVIANEMGMHMAMVYRVLDRAGVARRRGARGR